MDNQTLGQWGEQLAQRYLKDRCYTIVATNWRYHRMGELDVVALTPDGQTLVCLEVKTGKHGASVSAVEQLTWVKKNRLAKLAQAFVQTHPQFAMLPVKIDALAITRQQGKGHIRHYHHIVQDWSP
jgi:putative endonuclease